MSRYVTPPSGGKNYSTENMEPVVTSLYHCEVTPWLGLSLLIHQMLDNGRKMYL